MKRTMLGLAVELMIPGVLAGVLYLVVLGIPRLVGGRFLLAVPFWVVAVGGGGYLCYRISKMAGRIYRG